MQELLEITPIGLEAVIYYILFLAGIVLFAFIIRRYIRLLLQFKKLDYKLDITGGIKKEISFVFGQKRLLDDPFSGVAHILIFWGFLIIAFGTLNFFGKGFCAGFHIPILYDICKTPFLFLLDLFSLLVTIGILAAVFKRYIIRPRRLSQSAGAALILILIFGLMVFDLLSDGFNMAAQQTIVAGSFIGNYLASLFWDMPQSQANTYAHIFWWGHFCFFMAMLNYVPLGKHMHVFSSFFNVFFTNDKAGTKLSTPNLEADDIESFGITKVEEHTWKDLLDGYSCTECGRCQDVCPAYATDKPLSPKTITMQLRAHAEKKAPYLYAGKAEEFAEDLIKDVITEDVIWSCTTCYACQRACPLFIKQFTKLIDYRRALVLNEGAISAQGAQSLKNIEKTGDPWGMGQSARAEWYKNLEVKHISDNPDSEWLFWVGCAGALDQRNIRVSEATVKLMNAAGVNYAILGSDETCTGDSARRLGGEDVFQAMARANVEMLKEMKVRKIFTNCPHCFNTLKNEYPDFGGNYEVVHTHQLLAELVKSGKLKLDTEKIKREKFTSGDNKITFHDSCYLGRHNNIYKPSRDLIDMFGTLVEMEKSGENSFCCGAGGGGMWLEEHLGKRINVERTEQALAVNANTIGVACPFCMTMLEDGLKTKDRVETHRVLDIVEILAAGI